MMGEIVPGATFTTRAPFVRYMATMLDADGPSEVPGWRPGAWNTHYIPPDDAENLADAEGYVEYNVVSVHKPPGYPERVFFRRVFITPDGKRLNGPKSRALRVSTTPAFRRRISGWPVPYVVGERDDP
jgi:hypothetical protein